MFATLWYKGVAVVWIGFAGMPLETCQDITTMMMLDVAISYSTPESADQLIRDGYEQQYWSVSCEQTPPQKDI